MKTSRAAAALAPFLAMDVMREARRLGPDVLHMEIGQPAAGAPAGAVAAAVAALSSGHALGYTDALGFPALRERLARHYADWYGLAVDPRRIAITAGASGAFSLAFLAALDPGDEVALATPAYPPYANTLAALGFRARLLPGTPDSRFQPTPVALDQSGPPPAALLFASPSNPAGTMLTPVELADLLAWARDRAVRVISDEIYHGLVHSGRQATAAADPDAIVVGSFSKYWCLSGWRVGWLVLPDALVRPVERLAQNLVISASHVAQLAALAALDCADELDRRVAGYTRTRAHLLDRLASSGFGPVAPAEGAFYAWTDISPFGLPGDAFCARLLAEARVAATPGADFDRERGGSFVRFSYCGPEREMRLACDRLAAFAAGLGRTRCSSAALTGRPLDAAQPTDLA